LSRGQDAAVWVKLPNQVPRDRVIGPCGCDKGVRACVQFRKDARWDAEGGVHGGHRTNHQAVIHYECSQ
jgi:hypothetical protein